MKHGSPVTLARFLEAGHRPRPSEAAAVVLELSARIRPGATSSVSPPIAAGTVLVDPAGCVATTGGDFVEDDQTASLLGHLLVELLRMTHEDTGARVPAGLTRLSQRAARALPGGGRMTVARLASGLRRFAPRDSQAAVRQMVERWAREDRTGVREVAAAARTDTFRWRRAWPAFWRDRLPARWRVLPIGRRKALPLDSAF